MKYAQLLEEMQKGSEFRGFSLNEIRFMRGCTTARIEMHKEKLKQDGTNFIHTGSISGKQTWMHKFFGLFSYIDYIFIAIKLFSGLRRLRR